jgi:hypothetical protein
MRCARRLIGGSSGRGIGEGAMQLIRVVRKRHDKLAGVLEQILEDRCRSRWPQWSLKRDMGLAPESFGRLEMKVAGESVIHQPTGEVTFTGLPNDQQSPFAKKVCVD